jgi:hypothetical protein
VANEIVSKGQAIFRRLIIDRLARLDSTLRIVPDSGHVRQHFPGHMTEIPHKTCASLCILMVNTAKGYLHLTFRLVLILTFCLFEHEN